MIHNTIDLKDRDKKKVRVTAKRKKEQQKRQESSRLLPLGLAIGLTVTLVTAGLFAVAFLVESSAPSTPALATHLPQESVVAYLEWNDALLPDSGLRLWTEAEGRTAAQMALVGTALKTGGGIAFVSENEVFESVHFWPIKTLPSQETLESLGFFSDKNGFYTQAKAPDHHIAMIDSYWAVSRSLPALRRIAKSQAEDSIAIDPEFQKANENLPRSAWLRGYLSTRFLPFVANQDLQKTLRLLADHTAFTVIRDDRGLRWNSYTAFRPDFLKFEPTAERTHFAYKLTELISAENLVFYTGGANLVSEWQGLLQTVQGLNPAHAIIMEGLLRAQARQFFGDAIRLKTDLYPLLNGDYALSVHQPEEGPIGLQLVLSHQNMEEAMAGMESLLDGFRSAGGKFAPRLESYTLPDGTETTVMVSDPDSMVETDDDYKGHRVRCIEITKSPYGFCYSVTPRYTVVANHLAAVQQTIDLDARPHFVLSQYQPFRKALGRLSQVGDEISFVDFKNLKASPKTLENPVLELIQAGIGDAASATWVKHFFRDGISMEGYLLEN